jgi:hypothetical protein
MEGQDELCHVRQIKGAWTASISNRLDKALRAPRPEELPPDVREEKAK